MEKITGTQCLRVLFRNQASMRVCEMGRLIFGRKGFSRSVYSPVLILEREGLVARHRVGGGSFVSLTASGLALAQYETSLMAHMEPPASRVQDSGF